jgi:hypothetical protein
MEIMDMDERQRMAWLRANRMTLFCVGVTWLGMIIWELSRQRIPYFMISMVPAFALIRLIFYRIFIQTRR